MTRGKCDFGCRYIVESRGQVPSARPRCSAKSSPFFCFLFLEFLLRVAVARGDRWSWRCSMKTKMIVVALTCQVCRLPKILLFHYLYRCIGRIYILHTVTHTYLVLVPDLSTPHAHRTPAAWRSDSCRSTRLVLIQ